MIDNIPSTSYIHPEQFQDTLSTANTIYDVLHDARAAETICPFRHAFTDALGSYTAEGKVSIDTSFLHKFDKMDINKEIKNIFTSFDDEDADIIVERCISGIGQDTSNDIILSDLLTPISDLLTTAGINMTTNDLANSVCNNVVAVQDCMYNPKIFEDESGDIWELAYHECTKHMHLATEDYTLVDEYGDPLIPRLVDDITQRRLEACMINFKMVVDAHEDMDLETNDNNTTYSDTYQACNACATLYTPIMNNLIDEALNKLAEAENQQGFDESGQVFRPGPDMLSALASGCNANQINFMNLKKDIGMDDDGLNWIYSKLAGEDTVPDDIMQGNRTMCIDRGYLCTYASFDDCGEDKVCQSLGEYLVGDLPPRMEGVCVPSPALEMGKYQTYTGSEQYALEMGGMGPPENTAGAISMDNVADTQACQVELPDNEYYTCNDLVGYLNQTLFEYGMDKLIPQLTLAMTCKPGETQFMDLPEDERIYVASEIKRKFNENIDPQNSPMCIPQQNMCDDFGLGCAALGHG